MGISLYFASRNVALQNAKCGSCYECGCKNCKFHQFDTFLRDNDIPFRLAYHTTLKYSGEAEVPCSSDLLREDIGQFMEKMGSPVKELECPQWVQDLAFMVDITQHLNNLRAAKKLSLSITTAYAHSS